MRPTLIRCLSLLCLGLGFSVQAQEVPLSCQVHANDAWLSVGTGNMDSCLASIESQVPAYNAQGFKFGLWGSTLLSADQHYFYQSADQGATWTPLRLKGVAAAPQPTYGGAPAAVAQQPQQQYTAPVAVQGGSSAVISAVAADASAATAVPMEPVSESVAPVQAAPQTAGGARNACSLQIGGRWHKLVNLTLEACAQELSRSPQPLDSNGFKYGYWAGTFLAANQTEVLSSRDRTTWATVLRR